MSVRTSQFLAVFGMFLVMIGAVQGQSSLLLPGTTKVGVSSQPFSVTLTAQTAGSGSAPVALTGGVSGLDFSISDPGTCGTGLELLPDHSCTVTAIFTPRYPGVRQGAIVLRSADGTRNLATTILSGIASGGLPVLMPGEINTVAGDGQWIYRGDGGAATSAPIFLPGGLTLDGAGNLYFSDSSNNRVRRVDASTGLISTVAGNGTPGAAGEGGAAVSAELNNPTGVVLDGAGNLYIADSGNNVVRRVDAASGLISTVVGTLGAQNGSGGSSTVASAATLVTPEGLALTPVGDLIVADTGNNCVRLIVLATNHISTLAGTGIAGYSGDGGAASAAQLNSPWGVAVRLDGAIAVADLSNHRIRLIDSAGNISTIAGNGTQGFFGDGGLATLAELDGPAAVVFDPAGDLIIADSGNNRVRGIYGSSGNITTIVGTTSEEFAGDAGPGNAASLYGPYALNFDQSGNLWVSDMFHNRIRKVNGSLLSISYPTLRVGKVSPAVAEEMYNAGNANLTLNAPTLSQAALDSSSTTCNQSAMSPMLFCNMGVEFAPTQVGTSVLGSVTWTSDAPNVFPIDHLRGEVLSVEPTSVALNSSANPGLLGQPVTLIANITSADTARTGTVAFTEGSTTWCASIPLAHDGTASCTIPSLTLGTHIFLATYSGDNNNASSASSLYSEIIKQQPALALAVSASPAVVTSMVTLTLTAADQTGTPTGTVVFYDGVATLATVTLNSSGMASWSTSTLSVGTHTLTAQYSGDTANAVGTSDTASEQITQATTSTILSSSATNAAVGAPLTLTATVVSNNGPSPTGSVTFTDAGQTIGSAALSSTGIASLTLSNLPPGTQPIIASYGGDNNDATSTSTPLTETIQQISTSTVLSTDANPLNAGATLHLTASVSITQNAAANGALTGTVTFTEGSTMLGQVPLNASTQATLLISTLGVGPHSIVATYGGTTDYSSSSSTALIETVQQTSTQVALSTNSATTLAGKQASFTAVVTSATGTPTGTVIFKDGAAAMGTVALNVNGSAIFSTTHLSQGTHTVTAVYGGDANYQTGISGSLQENVQLAAATLALSAPSNDIDAGTTAQFVATLATPGIAPTGTVTLQDGGSLLGTQTVAASGNISFSSNSLAIGTHTLTAFYSGDASNAAVTSSAVILQVQQASSATRLISSANPLTLGGPLTLTALVTSDSPDLSGQVQIFDGAGILGKTVLGPSGTAIFSPTNLSLGRHSLTAVYVGDTNHASSISAILAEIVVQSSTASISSSNNPSASGQNVIFIAQISGPGSLVPEGSVTFTDSGVLLATVPLNSAGAANFATTALTVGTHTIAISYSGNSDFAATSAQFIQTVTNASTQVTISSGANPATYGQSLSLTAMVTSNGGPATGTVSFTDSGATIGSAQLNASGTAILSLSSLAPGLHSIVANYAGDGKASASVSTPLAVIVKQTTSLLISSTDNPALTLSSITLKVSVAYPGAAIPTGTVTFTDGGTVIGTAQINVTGGASLNLMQMTAGTHSVVASYAGDGSNFASTSPAFTQTVQLRSTSVTVTGSSTDATNPQQVTLIAVVKGAGSVPPTGSLTFTSGALTLGTGMVDSTGVATLTVIFETTSEPLVASYAGDASYASSASTTTTITAGQAAQFTLALDQQNLTLASRQHMTVSVMLGSVRGFSDTIELGCSGLPYAATCTFSKTQMALAANGTLTAMLVVDTGDPLGSGTSAGGLLWWLPAGLGLGLLGRGKRHRLGSLLVFACALAFSIGATGCGGLSVNGTPPGKYSFKVVGTGQGSGSTQAQTVTLVVT